MLEDILNKVYKFKEKNDIVWFRGHSSENYKLNSGLYRITNDKDEIYLHENNIYNCFLNYGDMFCNNFYHNKEWNILFLMQHYGMYTRLLDWTSSFSTALYFALSNKRKDTKPCIWMINPIELNNSCRNLYEKGVDKSFEKIGMLTVESLPQRIRNYKNYFESTVDIGSFAMIPRRSNERIVSQNGFFTIQGTRCIPLEEEYNYEKYDFIDKLELNYEVLEECERFLDINGINSFSMWGGVEGLCNYIKKELLHIELTNI